MLNYTYVEKATTAPLSCDVSSKSQLSSSSTDVVQCVVDASTGQGDRSTPAMDVPPNRSGPPAHTTALTQTFHQQHRRHHQRQSQPQATWLVENPQGVSFLAGQPMMSGPQPSHWGQLNDLPRGASQPPLPLPFPGAASFAGVAIDNPVRPPTQQWLDPFCQSLTFGGVSPPGPGGLVPPLLSPAMLSMGGNVPYHQWRFPPFRHGGLPRSVPAATLTVSSACDGAYVHHRACHQACDQNRHGEYPPQCPCHYPPHMNHHNFHNNIHHRQYVCGATNASPAALFYGEVSPNGERGIQCAESSKIRGNQANAASCADWRRWEAGKGVSGGPPLKGSRLFHAEDDARYKGVVEDDYLHAMDQSCAARKFTVGLPGNPNCPGEKGSACAFVTKDEKKDSNSMCGRPPYRLVDECGYGASHFPQCDSLKSFSQHSRYCGCDGPPPLGESFASTAASDVGKTNKIFGTANESVPMGSEGADEERLNQAEFVKVKRRTGNLRGPCSSELRPSTAAPLGDHKNKMEAPYCPRLLHGGSAGFAGHALTNASPTLGGPTVEGAGEKRSQGHMRRSPTIHRAMQWCPLQPNESQRHQSNAMAGVTPRGGYCCTELCTVSEQAGRASSALEGDYEARRNATGSYLWKSPSSRRQQHMAASSPTQMLGMFCGDGGGGRSSARTPSSAGSWVHTRAPATVRRFPHHPPLYEHHGALEDLFDEGDIDLPFEPQIYGNIVSFICAVSPILTASRLVESPTVSPKSVPRFTEDRASSHGHHTALTVEPSIPLRCIWESLDMPFACTVRLAQPVPLAPKRFPQETVVYSPFLSGFRLRFLKSSRTYTALKSMQMAPGGESRYSPRRWPSSACASPSRARQGNGIPEDDGDLPCFASTYPAAVGSRANSCHAAPAGKASPSGNSMDERGSDADVGWLTWGATERPEQRSLVLEQVRDLAAQDPRYSVLLSANVTELDYQSWFAVLWRPVFDQNHCAKHNCGSFIVYYAPRPPRHEIAPLSQSSSALECMNKNWMSPVFRADREALRWDMWAPSRREVPTSAGVPAAHTPASASPGYTAPLSPALPPLTLSGAILAGGSASGPTFEHSAESNAGNADVMAVGEASVASIGAHETRNTSPTLSFVECATNAASLGSHCGFSVHTVEQPFCVRIPVVGIIPSRCRADVWFMPCFRDRLSETDHLRDVGTSGVPPVGSYCAPLFLLAAALQLMSWNAMEEHERQAVKRAPQNGGSDSFGSAMECSVSVPAGGGVPSTASPGAPGVSPTRLSHDEKPSGVKLMIEAAKYYRQYREAAHADPQVGTPTPKSTFSPQEPVEASGRTRPVSPSLASNAPAAPFSDPGAVVAGLPDFYQWAQFDVPLLRFAERYV